MTAASATGYHRPSDAEFARRRTLVADLLASSSVDALVVYGNAASHHDIRFLAGWPPGWDSFLVWAPGELPYLLVPSPNHVPTAAAMSAGLASAEELGADPIGSLTSAISRSLRGGRRCGLVGPMPAAVQGRLIAAMPGVEFVDLAGGWRELRLVKSAEEIEWTRRAANLCDAGIRALVEAARPGVRDVELVAAVEHAYRVRGAEHGICFLASAPMAGGGRIVPAQQPSGRRLHLGDAVTIELSAGVGGFTGQVLRTIAVGRPPQSFRRLHEVAERTFHGIAEIVRPGTTAQELLNAAGLIEQAGLTIVDDVVHGYGGGYLPPVIRTPLTQRRPVAELALRPGMMVVVQPNVVTPDGRLGVQTGELLVVTLTGHERLHRVRRGLLRAHGF